MNDKPKIVAIIQARMASSRLPGKMLMDLCGQPVLEWSLRRARRATLIDELLLATTESAEDDAIAEFCDAREIAYIRGSMQDVLDRYYQAANASKADVIVRITGDCPLIDAEMIDSVIQQFLAAQPDLDFAANRLPGDRTIPIGLDIEIVRFAALEQAWKEAQQPHQREHVMPFFYENPERFAILHIRNEPDYGHFRWTVDTAEDLELLRAICGHFQDDHFSWKDVLNLFDEHPDLAEINAQVLHKNQFDVDERQ